MKHSTIEISKEGGNTPDGLTLNEFKDVVMSDLENFIREYQKLNSEKVREIEEWADLYSNWLESYE